ncbi:hypothetical protein [Arthrobacter sp. A5]|uniref:hypothetical protein n=1 Tax=Arthrobacter sp. A5 TaxID=576926 RepID=UPI003DA8A627
MSVAAADVVGDGADAMADGVGLALAAGVRRAAGSAALVEPPQPESSSAKVPAPNMAK